MVASFNFLQDLNQNFAITDPTTGQPTDYFMRLILDRGTEQTAVQDEVIIISEEVEKLSKYFTVFSTLDGASSTGTDSISIGPLSLSSSTNGLSIGKSAQSSNTDSVAIGPNTFASGTTSTAVGSGANASGENSFALGRNAVASGSAAFAIGTTAQAAFASSIAFGGGVVTSAANQIAIGLSTQQIRAAGIPTATANSLQTGSLSMVTTDSGGRLGFSAIPSGGGSANSAWVTTSAGGAIPNSTITPVTFVTEREDSGGFWDSGSPTRFTITTTGVYQICGTVRWSPDTGNGRRSYIRKNGSNTLLLMSSSTGSPSSHNDPAVHVSCVVRLVAGDYVELCAEQNDGVSVNLSTSTATPTQFQIAGPL